MAYDTNPGNNTLYPRTFYALYIGPNNNGIGHLIFELSTKEIFINYNKIPTSIYTWEYIQDNKLKELINPQDSNQSPW